mgnify:CR=1 FL=1
MKLNGNTDYSRNPFVNQVFVVGDKALADYVGEWAKGRNPFVNQVFVVAPGLKDKRCEYTGRNPFVNQVFVVYYAKTNLGEE